jgi:hypothetical protein
MKEQGSQYNIIRLIHQAKARIVEKALSTYLTTK